MFKEPSTSCVKALHPPVGTRAVTWVGNKRLGRIEVQKQVWTVTWDFTLDNYQQILTPSSYEITKADGTTEVVPGQNMTQAFINSLAVAIPSTIIPILIAAFAAYGFAWMNFPGRRPFFILIIGLLVVPLQLALVPILRDYNTLGLNGTFLSVWLAHTGFGLALATYLLYNYISTLPRETYRSRLSSTALRLSPSSPAWCCPSLFQRWPRSPSSSSCGSGTITWWP